jgi:3-hydroxyacyl-CoA dehydrogenase
LRNKIDAGPSGKVVILGGSGVMGPAVGEIFAAAGYQVALLARDMEKARAGLAAAQAAARAEVIAEQIIPGTYDADLVPALEQADIVFEALTEDMALKREFFAIVDRYRNPASLVATNSSGLSIAGMSRGFSDSFRRNFLGIHTYNPPHILVGTEVIPNPDTDPEVLDRTVRMLTKSLGRKVVVVKDRPAFIGNRVGIKVMNEVAHLAARHGIAFIDYLIGPHTGRAMAPLRTLDLVGWDVYKAIADNVYLNSEEDGPRFFKLPDYVQKGIAEGRLGDKTPELGGFYRTRNGTAEVLNPSTGGYEPLVAPEPIEFVEHMKQLHRVGKYREAIAVLAEARGSEADIARRVVLGYVSYALTRLGEVAQCAADVDTIMTFGFNWAPPTVLVDLFGARAVVDMLRRYGLAVPSVVEEAVARGGRLFAGGMSDYGRTFVA